MHAVMSYWIGALAAAISVLPQAAGAPSWTNVRPSCRYLPRDAGWPAAQEWAKLNQTLGGKLIAGAPLAQSCFAPHFHAASCEAVAYTWERQAPFYDDPVNFMSPYWLNNTCSPFLGSNGTCTLGNLASYAINVSDVASVVAGFDFARTKNIRLTVKNTGHDVLGRSSGKGSLALWTHNLKDITFLNFSNANYTGPAARIGAGVLVFELYEAASKHGYQVPGGSCPTVGVAGGWTPGGGHGPLTSAYGLGADNVLEFEVVTADGKHLNASATNNPDLYWALSGGGPGNFGVVLSITHKAHKDVPVVGAKWHFNNDNTTTEDAYWAAIEAWVKYLPDLDVIPKLKTILTITKESARMDFATWPGATVADMTAVMTPFYQVLKNLSIPLLDEDIVTFPTFNEHYTHYATDVWTNSMTCGNRHIPRSLVQQNLPGLTATLRETVSNSTGIFSMLASNVTHKRVGNEPGSNAVQPAWRDSLFSLTMVLPLDSDAPVSQIEDYQAQMNKFQGLFKALTPGGGSYINEATFDNPAWKEDYFGAPYERLSEIKSKYDPKSLFWAEVAVASDNFVLDNGRLCAAHK
ncbi:MAG: hypothetical protein Q9187_001744 [Circinaria calcarea]